MKLPGLLTLAAALGKGATGLTAIATELAGIRHELSRLADAAEGHPRVVAVPDADDGPELAVSESDRHYAQIEAIEARYLALAGRLPAPEELERELAGEEVAPEVSAAAYQKRYGRSLQGLQ